MNSYSDNITASLEISRNCLRRIARNDDTEFSPQSIMNLMDKFVKTVNTMDETILVPCRLMDMKVGDENDPTFINKKHEQKQKRSINESYNSVDLFQIYNMLHNIKADLLYGQGQLMDDISPGTNTTTTLSANNVVVKGHVRRPSTVSVTSTNSSTSSTISDSESDAGNEIDSGIEESPQDGCCNNNNNNNKNKTNRTDQVADNFRRHLIGLTRSLKQMTETAQYLTTRYQHNIVGSV